jgi:hypothetical protein
MDTETNDESYERALARRLAWREAQRASGSSRKAFARRVEDYLQATYPAGYVTTRDQQLAAAQIVAGLVRAPEKTP